MRGLLAAALALALVPAGADAAGRSTVVGCSKQSSAPFYDAYRERTNLVIGPLGWLGAYANGDVDGALDGGYRWKLQVLVRPGHAVTMRIGAAAASFARLSYAQSAGWEFRAGSRTYVFRACDRAEASSRAGGRPVTFWAGGIVATRASICLPVEIRIDRGRVRHRTIALNARC